jgi:hypothetical protein
LLAGFERNGLRDSTELLTELLEQNGTDLQELNGTGFGFGLELVVEGLDEEEVSFGF